MVKERHVSKDHGREDVERGFLHGVAALGTYGHVTGETITYNAGTKAEVTVAEIITDRVSYRGGLVWLHGGTEVSRADGAPLRRIIEVVSFKVTRDHPQGIEEVRFRYTGVIRGDHAADFQLSRDETVIKNPRKQVHAKKEKSNIVILI